MTYNILPEQFTRLNNDINGNPIYVVFFMALLTEKGKDWHIDGDVRYANALKNAKRIYGMKSNANSFAGGIKFQVNESLKKTCEQINSLLEQIEYEEQPFYKDMIKAEKEKAKLLKRVLDKSPELEEAPVRTRSRM